MVSIPTGYEVFMKAGNKEEAYKIVLALKKENPRKKYKVKKLGYREYGVLRYKY